VTSGGYGYSLEHSIAYAFVPATIATGTAAEIEIFGTWVRGKIAREPLFDPEGTRVRS
jgi:glycine cleavage system aminomethyltransferase T